MKFCSYRHLGRNSYGVVKQDGVVDLGKVFGARAPDLRALLAQGLLEQASRQALDMPATLALADIELLPVIPDPGAIVCVGLNYAEHVREVGRDPGQVPTLFLRLARSQLGHGQPLMLPRESRQLDFEGEIAVIIGKSGRRIDPATAWEHVAGYACYNDASLRDWQAHSTQWTAGKNFSGTGAFGPWMVSADEIAPGQVLTLVTRLNGSEVQRSSTDRLIHDIPSLLAYISRFMPLEPGDVIVTGTPGGVGFKRQPPLFMGHGDVVEVEVDAIGILRNPVIREETSD